MIKRGKTSRFDEKRSPLDIKAYIGPIRKWWWLIAAATLLAGISSYIAVSRQPSIYESRTTLMVGRAISDLNPSGNEFYLGNELAGVYADMAERQLVRTNTMEALGIPWLPEYYAYVVPRSQLVEIQVIDTVPERAQQVAAELANQLIKLSPASADEESGNTRTSFVNKQLDDLQRQIEATSEEIDALEIQLGDLFSAREISDTQNQIQVLQIKLETLRSNYASLLSSTQEGASNALTIIEPASLPTSPIGPEILQTIVAAMAIGLALAVGAAYVLEFLDDTIKSTDDVEELTRVPNFAGLSFAKIDEPQEYLVTLTQPRSPISESFRELRTAIQFSNVDNPNRVLLVTSGNPGEGKSFTAANLAVVLAQAGHSVLLIDGDLRRPQQHLIFGMDSQRGLTSLLLESDLTQTKYDAEILDEFIQKAPEFWLGVMTCGPIPPNPSELLGSAKMKKLLSTLSEMYDYLIIDSSPVMPVTDAAVLSTQVDGVLIVTAVGATKRNHLRHMVERLKGYRANILGTVVNKINSSQGGYYYHYGHEYYGTPGEEVEQKPKVQKRKKSRFRVNGRGEGDSGKDS